MGEAPALSYQVTNLPTEGITLCGELPFAAIDIQEDDRFSFPHPLHYSLKLLPVGPDVIVTGSLNAVVQCLCDRCDGAGELKITTSDVCHRYKDVAGQVVDLTEDIREDILMVFPISFLCGTSCKGLCLGCGQNLNLGPCACPDQKQAQPKDENPWSALDKLNF